MDRAAVLHRYRSILGFDDGTVCGSRTADTIDEIAKHWTGP